MTIQLLISEMHPDNLTVFSEICNDVHGDSEARKMEEKRIIEKMEQLAKQIHYEPKDISYLAKAMCVNKLENGNTSNKEYTNGSLGTLGDAVLKLIITEKLYLEGKDRGEITEIKSNLERNEYLNFIKEKYQLQTYAYNDNYFFDETPKHDQLTNSGHDVYFEAIVGAVYLDRGLQYCSKWVKPFIWDE